MFSKVFIERPRLAIVFSLILVLAGLISLFKLLVGSTVRVTLTKKQAKKVPAIAPSAVMYDSRGAFVYVVGKENKVEKRYVVPGNSTPEWQLFNAGLKPGETVIVQGTHKTMPGATVEPRSAGKKK